MQIRKRNGQLEAYDSEKIRQAVLSAFESVQCSPDRLDEILQAVEARMEKARQQGTVGVEQIQDMAEQSMMEAGCYEALKSFILYRDLHARERRARQELCAWFTDLPQLEELLKEIRRKWKTAAYSMELLQLKFQAFYKSGMKNEEKLSALIQAAVELTTKEAPDWEYIAARLLLLRFRIGLEKREEELQLDSFYQKIRYLTEENLYGSYILENYTKEEIDECASFMDRSRDELFNYSGLELLLSRYVIRSRDNVVIEAPQEMYLGIALHLAMREQKNRLDWVRRFYDMLSTLKVTMATPTLSNARKPYHQLSSCFIDTVPDSLDGIYRSIDNFAKVSKFGGAQPSGNYAMSNKFASI